MGNVGLVRGSRSIGTADTITVFDLVCPPRLVGHDENFANIGDVGANRSLMLFSRSSVGCRTGHVRLRSVGLRLSRRGRLFRREGCQGRFGQHDPDLFADRVSAHLCVTDSPDE